MVYLVTGLSVGGIYRGEAQALDKQCHLNKPDIKSVPFLELFYVFKNQWKNLHLISFLAKQGLGVPTAHVLVLTGSSSAMLQL